MLPKIHEVQKAYPQCVGEPTIYEYGRIAKIVIPLAIPQTTYMHHNGTDWLRGLPGLMPANGWPCYAQGFDGTTVGERVYVVSTEQEVGALKKVGLASVCSMGPQFDGVSDFSRLDEYAAVLWLPMARHHKTSMRFFRWSTMPMEIPDPLTYLRNQWRETPDFDIIRENITWMPTIHDGCTDPWEQKNEN
jgi:hypothetical protein